MRNFDFQDDVIETDIQADWLALQLGRRGSSRIISDKVQPRIPRRDAEVTKVRPGQRYTR